MSSSAVDRGDEEAPLLRKRHVRLRMPDYPSINLQHWYSHPFRGEGLSMQSSRQKTARFLSSKIGHYSVLGLVILDVLGIIAGFILNLFKCEQDKHRPDLDTALDALGIVSLAFSCLFMLEVTASVWAFGWSYFRSWFHCFDALVVVSGFVVDVILHGIIEEAASLIVIMRLWRVFKIIEELSVGAQEQTEDLQRKIEELENDNRLLSKENAHLRRTLDKAGVQHDGHNTPPTPD